MCESNGKFSPTQSADRDARGRPATFIDPYELNLLRRDDVIPQPTLGLIAAEVGFGLPKWHRRGYLACVLILAACVVFLVCWKVIRGSGVDPVERVLWPINLAIFALGAVQFWRKGRRVRAERIGSIMLRHRRCPHCAYDIHGLPRDPADGATICPECGTAWFIAEAADAAGC